MPQTVTRPLTLVILAVVLQISSGGLPNGQVGVPFQAAITGNCGIALYKWSETGQTTQKSSSITMAADGPSAPGKIVIVPSAPPVVNQGTGFQFIADAAGTWSCSGTDGFGKVTACQGSIYPATGLYSAPAIVKAQQSFGGFQLLPNNHVFNTRIDSLPVNSNSSAWIAGAGKIPINYLPSFPVNYVDNSTPTQNEVFFYSPATSGTYPMPTYPTAQVEGGWLAMLQFPFGADHHLDSINTDTGQFVELYDIYSPTNPNSPAPYNTCATCNAVSGDKYMPFDYALPASGGNTTDAAGMYIFPLTLHLQELENALATGRTINHALRFTLQNGYILGAGSTRHIWPATAEAFAGGGIVPYGARFRLKSSFDISRFSAIAKILLTQLKQYGIILADGGYGWQVTIDYTKWPADYYKAFQEIQAATIGPSNFEAVDESNLMIAPSSGETTANRETIVFTRASDSATSSVDVVLTGVTVNMMKDAQYIQAGTQAQQLIAYAHGATDIGLTWRMNPSIGLGTLTRSGMYTPPATISSVTTTTVTATSRANSSVSATMQVTIFPPGTIRIIAGQATPYRDTRGNVWAASTGDNGGFFCSSGGSWPSTQDILLYESANCSYYDSTDMRYDITVPNGSYQITAKYSGIFNFAGGAVNSLESQGQVYFPVIDMYVYTGNKMNVPVDFVMPAVVTNNTLSFVIRQISGARTYVDSLQIAPSP